MEISDKQKNKIEEIAQKYQLKLILLFGSRATGRVHKESDFDIAYLANMDFTEEDRFATELMEVFRSEKIDIVNLKRAQPVLMKQIFDSHIILFCGDFKIYSLYQIYAIKKYIEAKPLFKLRDEFTNNFLKEHGYR